MLPCNAVFDSGKDAAKHHWIPCVFKEQVHAEEYEELTLDVRRQFMREVTGLQKQMQKHLGSEDADATCESLEMQRQEPLDLSIYREWWLVLDHFVESYLVCA